MHRSVCSVPLNIAEANGRRTGPDKARHLVIATGSALECAAALDIAARLHVITPEERERLRTLLLRITRMLITLTRSVRTRHPPSRS
jgi:four helix bundle protein